MPAMEQSAVRRSVTITTEAGLHARPASLVAKAAAGLPAVVFVAKGDTRADARSILALLSLGADQGDTVTLEADGAGAEESVDVLAALLAP